MLTIIFPYSEVTRDWMLIPSFPSDCFLSATLRCTKSSKASARRRSPDLHARIGRSRAVDQTSYGTELASFSSHVLVPPGFCAASGKRLTVTWSLPAIGERQGRFACMRDGSDASDGRVVLWPCGWSPPCA
jgi:hypothetical protein